MESKTWYTSSQNIEKGIEIRSHFGWVELAKTTTSFTMKRERSENYFRLKKLEKQYDSLTKKAPFVGIVFASLGAVLALLGFFAITSENVKWIFILVGLVLGILGITFIAAFLMTLPYRKKMIKEIFEEGDQLQGKRKTLPLYVNIRKADENSNHIREAITNGELDIRY